MGRRGPAPKGYMSRERDQKRLHEDKAVEVVPDGVLRGEPLPSGMTWHPATIEWWNHWRESPVTQLWEPSDWNFALATAVAHSMFHLRHSSLWAAELRQREAKMGQTVDDRMRLHIRIVEPNEEEPDAPVSRSVVAIDEYRRNVGG